jgi:hypothetical protein
MLKNCIAYFISTRKAGKNYSEIKWNIMCNGLQEEPDEHGQGKREGKQRGKSDKRITESKAQQKEALHCPQT